MAQAKFEERRTFRCVLKRREAGSDEAEERRRADGGRKHEEVVDKEGGRCLLEVREEVDDDSENCCLHGKDGDCRISRDVSDSSLKVGREEEGTHDRRPSGRRRGRLVGTWRICQGRRAGQHGPAEK